MAGLRNEQVARYKSIVQSSVHPVTGDIIPALFRVSAIAPVNIPLVMLMITTLASNVPGTLFLHWVNQSYNTACNYANRSGLKQDMSQLGKAYVLAVASACSIAFGLGKLVQNSPRLHRFGVLIPCVATAAANVSNIGFTRMSEITDGTQVSDGEGNVIGMSRIAGYECVKQTAITRCVLVPTACFLLPPLVNSFLRAMRLMPTHPHFKLLLEVLVVYASLQGSLPLALAMYPQTASFSSTMLEPQFHNVYVNGKEVKTLYANKGL